MNEKVIERNELFKTSHMVILIAFTVFSLILMGESFLMGWEKWALVVIFVGIAISWTLHIRQILTEYNRLWVYSFFMMGTFFFLWNP